jgi:hypothetical protein
LKASDLPNALGEVRALTTRYLSGTQASFDATRDLLNYLLRVTVMDDREHVRFLSIPGNQRADTRTLGSRVRPIPLNDGHYLRLMVNLSLDPIENAQPKLRVYSASYQYQLDPEGENWVLRYDYARVPNDRHPASHLQVRAKLLAEGCLPEHTPFERIHLPTGRMTLEAVIRLLVEQFEVPCNESEDIWRPILAESERAFELIAHRHISGPAS